MAARGITLWLVTAAMTIALPAGAQVGHPRKLLERLLGNVADHETRILLLLDGSTTKSSHDQPRSKPSDRQGEPRTSRPGR